MQQNKTSLIVLIILIIILIFGGIYYFGQKNKSNENTSTTKNSGGAVEINAGNSNTGQMEISNGNSTSSTGISSDGTITSGEVYLAKITEIRKPINSGFDDLNEKLKYTTLFTEEDTKNSINNLKGKISDAKKQINDLKISKSFENVNKQELDSLGLLTEAVDAFENMFNSTTQEEKQKYYDIYGYKIDQSNKILNEIAIPKS